MGLEDLTTQSRAIVIAQLDRRPGAGGKHKEHRRALRSGDERAIPSIGKANADIPRLMPGSTDPLRTLENNLGVVAVMGVRLNGAARRVKDFEDCR